MKISVVVPTKNAELRALEGLSTHLSECLKHSLGEVIFVDQTEGRSPSITSVQHHCTTEPRSAIAARQLGASLSTFEWIMFLDDDIHLCDDFLNKLRRNLDKNDSVVSPILFDSSHNLIYCFVRALIEIIFFSANDKRAINRFLEKTGLKHVRQRYLWGGCFIVKKDVSIPESLQLYNLVRCPGHPIQMGDIILGEMISNKGIRIKTIRGLRVTHDDPNFGISEQYLSNKLKQIDVLGYGPFQAFLYRLIVRASVRYRRWSR